MELIASAGDDTNVNIWNISSGEKLKLEAHRSEVFVVCFSPCGGFLASASYDGTIILWDCQSLTRLHTFSGQYGIVVSISFNGFGDKFAATTNEGVVRVWSLTSRTKELSIDTNRRSSSVSFNCRGDAVAVTCMKDIRIYDAHTGKLKQTYSGHTSYVKCVQFSRDGGILVSGSYDNDVIVWDVPSGSVLRELRGHINVVSDAKFNADASRIVSCSWDKTARIWDVSTGECLLILIGHRACVMSCCFSEDGSKVITGCDDGTIKVWDSDTGEELRTLSSDSFKVRSVSCRSYSGGSYL